jgi:hypothetical protein
MSEETFRVLLIENDVELTTLLEQLLPLKLAPQRSTVVVKQHMEEARVALRDELDKYSGMVVDVMLPRSGDDLVQLEGLEKRRRELLRELKTLRAKRDPQADERILRLRQSIDDTDKEIEAVQDLEGGVTLLKEITPEGKRVCIPTVFFTARGLHELRKRAEALVEPGLFTWIQKPASATAIAEALLIRVGQP